MAEVERVAGDLEACVLQLAPQLFGPPAHVRGDRGVIEGEARRQLAARRDFEADIDLAKVVVR